MGQTIMMECLPRAIISAEREGKNVSYLNLWLINIIYSL